MTLLRETPKDHGLLLDHDPQGNAETLHHPGRQNAQDEWAPNPERRGENSTTGVSNPHPRSCGRCRGRRLQPQDVEAKQYHPISEEEAVQIQLLMDAVGTRRRQFKKQNHWAVP